MIWLIILTLSLECSSALDTLKYDDGIPDGFYVVGDYKNDKFGVKFEYPHKYYKVLGVLVFTNNSNGFTYACLCPDSNGLPDTLNPWAQVDSVYSAIEDWIFTPIPAEINDTIPFWFILGMSNNPAVGGDTNNPSGHSWYYSDIRGWERAYEYNWLIRLVVHPEIGYYEDFADSDGGYIGNWEFGVPSIIEPLRDNCFGIKLDTLYPNNTYFQLESPWISIKNYGLQEAMLSFKHFYDTQKEYDGGNVKISKDSVNWILRSPLNGYDIVLSGANGIDGELGFSGESDGWRKEYFLLPPWDSLKIRWCFGSDEVASDLGWFVDEVKIGERTAHDIGILSTNFQKIVLPETTFIPEIEIKNFGIYSEVLSVECIIESSGTPIYQDNKLISSFMPDSTTIVSLKPWHTGPKNLTYTVKVYTDMPEDENHTNDTIKVTTLTFRLITEFTAGWTDTSPSIDGIIDSIEWKDAVQIDGSDVLGIDTENPPGSCILYFMNSHSTLYIACKAESLSEIKLYIDDSGNREWDHDGREGFYWITSDKYGFQDMYYHFVYSLPDSLKSIGPEGVELGIPIGTAEPYEITPVLMSTPGCSLGCFISASSQADYTGWWPQFIINYNNPINYAQIKLTGTGVEENPAPQVAANFSLRIFPNPFYTKTNIELLTLNSKLSTLKIYDLTGRLVHSFPINQLTNQLINYIWDGSNLPSGIYFLVYKCGTTKITKKLTILR